MRNIIATCAKIEEIIPDGKKKDDFIKWYQNKIVYLAPEVVETVWIDIANYLGRQFAGENYEIKLINLYNEGVKYLST